ncbi:unnamed protein product, partial [Effrenium voratum]
MSKCLALALVAIASAQLDDECEGAGGAGCALQAIQLRARATGGDAESLHLSSFGEEPSDELLWTKYQFFLKQFRRQYGVQEQERRFLNFKASFRTAKELAGKDADSSFGINGMADFDATEKPTRGFHVKQLSEQLATLGSAMKAFKAPKENLTDVTAINWRLTRAISPVKNQGACGACWAFVTAEEVESLYTLWQGGGGPGYSEIFSAQQLISCDEVADGCGGGNPVDGYAYIVKSKVGLVQEAYWPYEGGFLPMEKCDYKSCTKPCNKDLSDAARFEHVIGPIARVHGAMWATPLCEPGSSCGSQDLERLRQ